MKPKLPSLAAFLALSLASAAQSTPHLPPPTIVPAPAPWIEDPVDSDDKPCSIAKLDVDAHVNGLFARVSTTFTIENPNARAISAPIAFPLPDGASVCGYALEINGAMIDGVVVPKEKARVAFETEQRRGVDPGLVESVGGNLWRTRVYPVPAHGERRVRIDWTVPLALGADGSSAALSLPMPRTPLAHRTVRIEVPDDSLPAAPDLGGLGDRRFEKAERFWRVSSSEDNVVPGDDLLVALPRLPDTLVSVERIADGETWFCASVKSPDSPSTEPEDEGAGFPNGVTVFWDASGSRSGDHAAEFDFLRGLKIGEGAPARLVVFRNETEKTREFADMGALVAALKETKYDGGTDFAALAAAIAANDGPAIVFTDGVDTLSGRKTDFGGRKDVAAIVTGAVRDIEAMRRACGGLAFGPNADPGAFRHRGDAVSVVGHRTVRALEGTGFSDVEGVGSDATRRATVVGKLDGENASGLIALEGGISIPFSVSAANAKPGAAIATAWAAMRVGALSADPTENETELLALGRRFGLAGPSTSLLVLESLDQWLRHDIEPPESLPEMRQKWLASKKRSPGPSPEERAERHFAEVARLWKLRMDWWNSGREAWSKDKRGPAPTGRPESPVVDGATALNAEFGGEAAEVVEEEGSANAVRRLSARSLASRFAMAGAAQAGAANGSAASRSSASESSAKGSPAGVTISVKPWSPDVPYLKALDATVAGGTTDAPMRLDAAKAAYLAARAEWETSPAFFLDCAGWFFARGDAAFAVRVLSNLAELRIEDPALLRVMAWRLKEARAYAQSAATLRRVCALRPEEPQSWRDLALVLDESGRAGSDGAALSEALSLYRKVALHPWARHSNPVSVFAIEEHNALLAWCEQRAIELPPPPGKREAPGPLPEELRGVPDCDLRVVLAWDADETDIDLHVTEPSGEEAFYGNRRTASGGDVSRDVTDGYGPEEYMIRKAPAGTYKVRAHYYASHQQAVFGPATATATAFSEWGRPEQSFRTLSIRLDKAKQMLELGSFDVGR